MKSNTCPRLIRSWESEVLFLGAKDYLVPIGTFPGKKKLQPVPRSTEPPPKCAKSLCTGTEVDSGFSKILETQRDVKPSGIPTGTNIGIYWATHVKHM